VAIFLAFDKHSSELVQAARLVVSLSPMSEALLKAAYQMQLYGSFRLTALGVFQSPAGKTKRS